MSHDQHPGANESTDRAGGALPASSDSNSLEQAEASERSRAAVLHDRATAAAARVKASAAGTFWTRLNALDFINSSMILAALSLTCLLPFLAVFSAATGGDVRHILIVRMGLNHQAATAVNSLVSSGHRALTTLGVAAAGWLILGAFGISGTLQGWYRKVYDRPQSQGVAKGLASQSVWIGAFLGYLSVQVLVGTKTGPLGGHLLSYAAAFGMAVIFWTFSPYLLLTGKVGWRALLPVGVATGICLTGLSAISALLVSSSVISGEQNYGPVGVVTALLSYIIGFGVCIHVGAVFGRMWNERHHVPTSSCEAYEKRG